MKKRPDKEKDVQNLHDELSNVQHLFAANFEKLTVEKDIQLRKAVRDAGGKHRVIKNTLAQKAAEGTPAEPVLKDLRGMTSISYTSSDPVALAKALREYAKSNATYTFRAGIVEGRVFEVQDIDALASMPSREEILARLLYLINAPAQRLASVTSAVGRNLAVVLNEAAKAEKFSS